MAQQGRQEEKDPWMRRIVEGQKLVHDFQLTGSHAVSMVTEELRSLVEAWWETARRERPLRIIEPPRISWSHHFDSDGADMGWIVKIRGELAVPAKVQ